jgi:hypothetical protein
MWKKFIIGVIGIFAFLVLVLAVHIYQVSRPKEGRIPNIAMSRIDFPKGIDSLGAVMIQTHFSKLEGIKDLRINADSGHVVCLYDNKIWQASDLVDKINFNFSLSAELYRPSADMLSQSCPVIDKSSLTYKLGTFFQKSFEN